LSEGEKLPCLQCDGKDARWEQHSHICNQFAMVNKQHMYSGLTKAKIKDQKIIITQKDYLNNRVTVNSAVSFRCATNNSSGG
jgi:hypothetical protein